MVKYSYYIARISSFIASKMQSSVTKNLVFPSCGDIKILQLLVCATAFVMLYDILAVPAACQSNDLALLTFADAPEVLTNAQCASQKLVHRV